MIKTLQDLALSPILGKPLIMWGGLLTGIFLITTLFFAILFKNGKFLPTSYKLHMIFAILTTIAALLHGTLGIILFM